MRGVLSQPMLLHELDPRETLSLGIWVHNLNQVQTWTEPKTKQIQTTILNSAQLSYRWVIPTTTYDPVKQEIPTRNEFSLPSPGRAGQKSTESGPNNSIVITITKTSIPQLPFSVSSHLSLIINYQGPRATSLDFIMVSQLKQNWYQKHSLG